MKIIEVAREQKDLLNEGIAYIALWQQATPNGRKSWHTEDFFPVDSIKEEPVFDEEQKARLAEIAAIDPDAVLLNGYYHSWIGSADDPLNATDISNGLKKHYEMHNALISDYLNAENEPAAETETVTDNQVDATDAPTSITIELPLKGANPDILRALIESKASLIKAALGEDYAWGDKELPMWFEGDNAGFNWLAFNVDNEIIMAWSAFIAAAVKYAKKAKRVTAKDKPVENEKFAFRTFLVKIGMNDIENKEWRRLLMRNLKGDVAYAKPRNMQSKA